MKSEKIKKGEVNNEHNDEDKTIKKLDSIIEKRKNENEALKKILIGLEKINDSKNEKNKKNKK